jgi:hypothetical protein
MGSQRIQRQPKGLNQRDHIAAEASQREAPPPLGTRDQGRNSRQTVKWGYTQT